MTLGSKYDSVEFRELLPNRAIAFGTTLVRVSLHALKNVLLINLAQVCLWPNASIGTKMRTPSTSSSNDIHQSHFNFMSVQAFRRKDDQLNESPQSDLDLKLIGKSMLMRKLKEAILLVARSDETVLITGESGTGKELVARAIHESSGRRMRPFLAVNCGALSESLLESELFGHVKGAFTGATTNKKGFFETASGGSIFLDEFAEMSLTTQQRLLRVLQEGKVRPVGNTETREIQIDTRVIVATNHDLKHDIEQHQFRHDLYYRVNVLQIHSPALRDRRDDILALAEFFIRKYNAKNSTTISERIPPDVLSVFEDYSWPGNVRELENIVKRLALYGSEDGAILRGQLRSISEFSGMTNVEPPVAASFSEPLSVSRKLNLVSGRKNQGHCQCTEQLDLYEQRVAEAGGNIAEAARQLNIPRTTLRNRLRALQRRCSS